MGISIAPGLTGSSVQSHPGHNNFYLIINLKKWGIGLQNRHPHFTKPFRTLGALSLQKGKMLVRVQQLAHYKLG